MRALYHITTPRFCGGIITDNHLVVRAAPCFRWMLGKPILRVWQRCKREGWTILSLG